LCKAGLERINKEWIDKEWIDKASSDVTIRATERILSNVVITGTGVISAAGIGASRIVRAMASKVNLFNGGVAQNDPSKRLPWPIAEVSLADAPWPDDDPWWINNQKFANVTAHWAVAAALAALKTAGTADDEDSARCGVVMAVSSGEEESVKIIPKLAALAQTDPRPLATLLYEEVPDYSYVRGIPSQTGQFIAKASGFRGSNLAVYGESGAAGFSAASLALRLLQSGELDRVIVVGVGAPLSPAALAALDRADPLGAEAAFGRGPFDVERRGALIGQGAAAIILEHKETALRRGIEPMAELACCEAVCASSLTQAIGAAIDLVLTQVNQRPGVWWAQGTGSVTSDKMECHAVAPLVEAATTSTKGTIGTAFECAGLIDIAVAVEALNQELVPPVGLLRTPDPALGEVDFVLASSRPVPGVRSALVTALGHAGSAMTAAGAALITRNGADR
jgi:3-oxoacyl-[acyl-carrier-protein] synthase II